MNHNQKQRVWEALLAVHSLDELDEDLRGDAEAVFRESDEFAAAWERVQRFDREVQACLTSDASLDEELGAGPLMNLERRVGLALERATERQQIDGVHNESELDGPIADESRELWDSAREFDVVVGRELADVDVPDGFQNRLLASLSQASVLAGSTTLAGSTAETNTAAGELVSRARPNHRRRWLSVGASIVVASLVGIVCFWPASPTPNNGSLEELAARCVGMLSQQSELAWASNTERMPWAMSERAEGRFGDHEATFFRLRQPGEDVYLVRVEHDLAQEMPLRLPFQDVAASGGWHVGAWSDGTHLYFACSRNRDALELFRANIQAI